MTDTVNVFAKELRKVLKRDIPFIKGAWVEFYDDITVDAYEKTKEAREKNDVKGTLYIIISQIADWNIADSKGKLPLTTDSLARIPSSILKWISEEQAKIIAPQEDVKKN